MSDFRVFEGLILATTPSAMLFQSYFWEGPLWLPWSQTVVRDDGMSKVVWVKPWLARKKQLEEFRHYTREDIDQIRRLV